MEGQSTEGRPDEVVTSLKRFATDLVALFIFAMLALLVGSLFHGREVMLLERPYPLSVVLVVLFAAIFLALTGLMFHDLRRALDQLSAMVIRHFPGMREDVPPMTTVMRSLVQIIILVLFAAVVMPLTDGLRPFGINLTSLISGLFLVLILVFIYVIARSLYALAQGYVGDTISNFVKKDSLLLKGRKKTAGKRGEAGGKG